MGIEAVIPDLAAALGVAPSTVLLLLGILVTAANIIGRSIPDDKTGFLGAVRTVAKVIGIYAPNKITSGVSVNDVASRVIHAEVSEYAEERIRDLANDAEALVPEVVQAFPGLADATIDSVDGIIEKTSRRIRSSRAKKGE